MANHPPKEKDKDKGKAAGHEGDDAPKKKKGMGMLFMLFCGAAVVGGGMFPLGYDMLYPPVEEHVEETEGEPHTEEPAATVSAFIPFGEVVGNLNDRELARFVRMKILLEVDSEQAAHVSALLPSLQAPLKNWLLGMISDKKLEDVQGGVALARMRREIRDRFNSYLVNEGREPVIDILFEEFNVQ